MDSQSTPTDGYEAEGWNSPSIGSRISTFWWMVGQRTDSPGGSTHRGLMYHDGSSDAPTMQGGEWPVRGQGRHGLDHRLVVVHLVDVERMSVR